MYSKEITASPNPYVDLNPSVTIIHTHLLILQSSASIASFFSTIAHYFLLCTDVSGVPGSRVWKWPGALMTSPPSTCTHTAAPEIQGSSTISSNVGRVLGLISSIRPIMVRLSRGRSRSKRQGPLMVSCLDPSDRLATFENSFGKTPFGADASCGRY